MTHAGPLRLRVLKEIRALSLVWLATLVAMLGSALVGGGRFRAVGMSAYIFGTMALGALSVGHEYTHRTLGVLLTQPARREHLFLAKLGVLAAMLLTLYAVATAAVFGPLFGRFRDFGSEPDGWLLLVALTSLSVAPFVTMRLRNPIAGTVFPMVVPGWLWLIGQFLGGVKYGFEAAAVHDVNRFALATLWWGTLVMCAVVAVMGWRTFMRLEAIDGGGQDVSLPRWLRWERATTSGAPHTTKRHPAWLLVKKELHLQQMTLAIAGLYLLGFLAVVALRPLVPGGVTRFYVITIFYAGLIAVLTGSLASAEERQLGTLEWQMLSPMSVSRQWALKVGVALSLTALLALGLPALLAYLGPAPDLRWDFRAAYSARPETVVPIVLLTIGSLYVSSLSSSGLRAVLVSLAAAVAVMFFLRFLLVSTDVLRAALPRVVRQPDLPVLNVLTWLPGATIVGLILRFALVNHRFADRPASRIATQVVVLGGCLTMAVIVLAALGR
jgi:hypothetical protein